MLFIKDLENNVMNVVVDCISSSPFVVVVSLGIRSVVFPCRSRIQGTRGDRIKFLSVEDPCPYKNKSASDNLFFFGSTPLQLSFHQIYVSNTLRSQSNLACRIY